MRRVFEDGESAARVGMRAREEILNHYNWNSVAHTIRERLLELAEG